MIMFIKTISISACLAALMACQKAETPAKADNYAMTAFAVKAGDSWYHATIDQNTHIATIGTLKNGDLISEVKYTLSDEKATINPDPSDFIGKWEKSQSVTITSEAETCVYTIEFPAWEDNSENLLFSDEFDIDGIPDTDKWVLCPPGTSDWSNQMSESYDQAYVKDGKLILTAEKKDGKYLAGGIKTQGKFGFTFGKVECRARITRHPDGAFPAIWMMPQKYLYSGWPACGEIDIMEHIKQEGFIHQTIHTHYRNKLGNNENTTAQTTCDYWDYNVYGVEWTEDELVFLVNGKETFRYSNMQLDNEAEVMQWPFGNGAEFYLILNMGLGDEGTWAGPIDDAGLPAMMEIDWIRVYRP